MSGSWLNFLQPASWRGVGFSVLESRLVRGRKTALHEYPFRDPVWVEDLGRGTRIYSFRGFLVGDDCYIQEQTMLAAVEVAGPGTLVHPSLGAVSVSLVDYSSTQTYDKGRMVELEFSFVEGQPAPIFPSFITNTITNVENFANTALMSVGIDFQTDIVQPAEAGAADLQQGAAVVTGAVAAVQGVVAQANSLVGDAGLVIGATKGLTGNFGRYSLGSLTGPVSGTSTLSSVLANMTTARTTVQDAGTEATRLANAL